jgi:hypothetical protein
MSRDTVIALFVGLVCGALLGSVLGNHPGPVLFETGGPTVRRGFSVVTRADGKGAWVFTGSKTQEELEDLPNDIPHPRWNGVVYISWTNDPKQDPTPHTPQNVLHLSPVSLYGDEAVITYIKREMGK